MSPQAARRPKSAELVEDGSRWEVRTTGEEVSDETIEALAAWLIERAERRMGRNEKK
ncbi:MAG TPA: hypothetical protein VMV10_02215 [Pirellulales bacterium]|nr:hypothetical protein [Pirellulales bacterium]